MDTILEGIKQSFILLIHGDRQVMMVAGLSLLVSGLATIISLAVGVPLGVAMALNRFPGRRPLVSLINAGMGAPDRILQ